MMSFYVLMNSESDKRLTLMKSNNIFCKWPCEGHYIEVSHIFCLRLSHVQLRGSITDWKMPFNDFWGANGWPSPQGFYFPKVMAAANDKVLWWRGSYGVHTPPGSIFRLLALYRHSAPWAISSLSILPTSRPLETPWFISHAASALFVCQQVMGKSKLKANL